jgi:hypothetical protein
VLVTLGDNHLLDDLVRLTVSIGLHRESRVKIMHGS